MRMLRVRLLLLIAVIVAVTTTSANAETTAETNLLRLAKERFTNDLSISEEKLFRAAANGELLYCSAGSEKGDDPANSSNWIKDRVIRANRLAWLCTDPAASAMVTRFGIRIAGMRIDGVLHLESANIPFSITAVKCAFTDSIVLDECHLRGFLLPGTRIKGLYANEAEFEGDFSLGGGFKAEREVILTGAVINGNIGCEGGQFSNGTNTAFDAERLKVSGSVFMGDGFKAEGKVNLAGATIDGSFISEGGQFSNGTNTALDAEGAKVSGSVFLCNGFKAQGEVDFTGATINGSLQCNDGQFLNGNNKALAAEQAKVAVVFLCNGFKAEGMVDLAGITISGGLNCIGGQFLNGTNITLNANGAKIAGYVSFTDGFKSEGQVNLAGATIDENLQCDGGQFINPTNTALDAGQAKIAGSVFLRGSRVEGKVNLASMTIGGGLGCDGGQFINGTNVALNVFDSRIATHVSLGEAFKAQGVVDLTATTIGGTLKCDGGQFLNKENTALEASGAKITGSVYLRNGFKAEGKVYLTGATIDGGLECDGGQFLNGTNTALSANGVKIGNHVFLRNGFKAEGEVDLVGATIGGPLECEGGQFFNGTNTALSVGQAKIEGSVVMGGGFEVVGLVSIYAATVGGQFIWYGVNSPEKAVLDLRSAKIDTLWDAEASWPANGNLHLDGFVYERLANKAPRTAEKRIKWLQLQSRDDYSPQPYEQLAAVLRKMGHEDEAAKVMIAKNEDYAGRLHWSQWPQLLWYYFIGKLAGYGYLPGRAFGISVGLIIFGMILFNIGRRCDLLAHTQDKAYVTDVAGTEHLVDTYPKFNAFIYSLETFVPLLNLNMAQSWRPSASRGTELIRLWDKSWLTTGSLLRCFLWLHIIFGWILTTLWIGALTGLVKT